MASQEVLDLGPSEAERASTTSEAITSSLEKVLRQASDADEAARVVGHMPVLLAECRRALPVVTRLSGAAGRDDVYVAMQPLIILWGRPDFGPGKIGADMKNEWVKLYGDALHKLSRESLDHAVSEWIKRGKAFMPKPSELHALAEPVHLASNLMAYRMRRAIERADAAHGQTQIDPEERARVKAQFAELRQALGAKANPMSAPSRLGRTPHQAAEELRRAAG